ncbi:uncharacterized protein LOC18437157 isoform X2 [Amborella trichopoda]|uniref:uncharacterized protein LOC18437157 isoform X2 n=1 Tax=Amborella trichopoda TaxID=13333 RepID=UPI0009C06E05|nr:uncharacterized protein LOC18437157 isoform X2 [Amborella trichopoda]|eukprot:XP_020524685.1 uncharacterized protein LOC18437157 isoform X2 [Amborella trichopoda]
MGSAANVLVTHILPFILSLRVALASANTCEFSMLDQNKLYNFSLASPIKNYPHGVLSEDGFYVVALNGTILWFQGCDGSLYCGARCSALVAENIAGYHVCRAIGRASNSVITLLDRKDPHKGVIVRMTASSYNSNCSLSVSVVCDTNRALGPNSLELLGTCDYATVLRHPAGCAKVISLDGNEWGWFGTLITIIVCLFGAYFLVGMVYRFFFLGIQGVEVVPNLEFWLSLPRRSQNLVGAIWRRTGRQAQASRSSYSTLNF